MALTLKNENGEEKNKQESVNQAKDENMDFSDLEQPVYKPIKISTDVPNVDDMMPAKKNDAVSYIIKGVVAVIIGILLFTFGKTMLKKIAGAEDITDLVGKSEEEIEKKLDIKLEDSPEKVSSVHQYSNGQISVSSNGDISVVYINGVKKGVKIDSKKYTMFGVKIGDPAYKLGDILNYNYTNSFNVINDMMSGKSTTDYYYNVDKNDCFIAIVNDDSGRVVSMSYYNDFKMISENLSGLDDD